MTSYFHKARRLMMFDILHEFFWILEHVSASILYLFFSKYVAKVKTLSSRYRHYQLIVMRRLLNLVTRCYRSNHQKDDQMSNTAVYFLPYLDCITLFLPSSYYKVSLSIIIHHLSNFVVTVVPIYFRK